MIKKELIEALKTKFDGVQDSILGRIADKLISSGKVKTSEDIADAVAGVTFQQVLENYGDSRADEAQKTAVKNYETKHNLKDGKPVEKPAEPKQEGSHTTTQGGGATTTPQGGQNDEVAALLKTILEQNKSMQAEIASMKQEKTANSRQAQLAEVLKNAPESVRTRYEKDFSRMSFKDDEDFNGWIGEITPDIQQMASDFTPPKPRAAGQPKNGTGGAQEKTNPYLQARVEERAKAAPSAPAIQGLTTPQTNP